MNSKKLSLQQTPKGKHEHSYDNSGSKKTQQTSTSRNSGSSLDAPNSLTARRSSNTSWKVSTQESYRRFSARTHSQPRSKTGTPRLQNSTLSTDDSKKY